VSTDVGALTEFADGAIRTIGVIGREIGIVRWHGVVYAVNNLCAHQSGPVCSGILSGRLTGHALHDARHRLRLFPVRVENGRVLVDIGPASDDPAVRS